MLYIICLSLNLAGGLVPFKNIFYFSSARAGETETVQLDTNWVEATNRRAAVKVSMLFLICM